MRSRLLKSADFAALPLPPLEIELEEEDLQSEIDLHVETERLLHRTFAEVPAVGQNSVVTVYMSSENPAFCRDDLMIHVGLGLFDLQAEQQLTGARVGDTVSVIVAGTPAVLLVKKIEVRRVPELDDAFVQALGLPGVSAKAEYLAYLKNYYMDFYRENYLIYFAMEFFRTWAAESEWVWDNSELDRLYADYHAFRQRYLDAHDTYMDGTEEELAAMEREEVTDLVQYYLYAQTLSPASVPAELSLDGDMDFAAIQAIALAPFEQFLADKVTFAKRRDS